MARIVKENQQIDTPLAERIVEQTLGFLNLYAKGTGKAYSPSAMVDIGWHTFLTYTREYANFCQQVAGRFIHHSPSDEEGVVYQKGSIARTVAAMQSFGITVDHELWPSVDAICLGYCSGDED